MPTPAPARIGSFVFSALFLVTLTGGLIVDSLLSGGVYLLSLCGLVLIGYSRLRGRRPIATGDREVKLIGFALAFFAVVSLASWVINGFGYEGFKDLGKHGRLLLFWPLFIIFSWTRLKDTALFWGLALASMAAGLIAVEHTMWGVSGGRAEGATNPIPFGNLSLLLGTMLLAVLPVLRRERLWGGALAALAAIFFAFTAAYLSGTRNNLIAFPVLLLFLIIAGKPHQRWLSGALGGLTLALFVGLDSRMSSGFSGLLGGMVDNGIQFRFDIWQKALKLFLEAPILGVGSQGYADAIHQGVASGNLNEGLIGCCDNHAHNDLLQVLATRGLLGALSWSLLLLIPFVQFARLTRHENGRVSAMATAGCLIPLAYLLFGLTEATFMRGIYLSFYLLTVTTLTYVVWRTVAENLQGRREQYLSTIIITYNEADNIRDCLASVQPVSDEIIVVDSGSTDETVTIAKEFTDNITVTDWPGFGLQKQRALEQASGDWVLSIDADERLTSYLAREINHELSHQPRADAYKLPWAVTLYGKRLDFGRSGRAPLRLFRREGVRFSDAMVHEKILLPEGRRTVTLRGRLTHYTHRDFGHALEKSAKYAWLGAQERYRKGRRTKTLIYPTFRAIVTFVQVYILRLGFLDGPVGFLVAMTYTQGAFNKYAGLWTLTRAESTKPRGKTAK
ncbi:glycosyl transferase [Halovibrio salipaludis]|uniref:Glycosyl transferase n=1 Tax=Halovibrio salipaludis TaxID=2032626 RepID=A0A2A2FA12_9GAMM|nr:glycosyltransferase [Halovibrio salipaludis]PAU82276.1 glycosyl transferase [Halovibrio salipaludis]